MLFKMVYDARFVDGRNSGNANRIQKIRPGTIRRQIDTNNPRYKLATPETPVFMPNFPSQRTMQGQTMPMLTPRQKLLLKAIIKHLESRKTPKELVEKTPSVVIFPDRPVSQSDYLAVKLKWYVQNASTSSTSGTSTPGEGFRAPESASSHSSDYRTPGSVGSSMFSLEDHFGVLNVDEVNRLEGVFQDMNIDSTDADSLMEVLLKTEAEAEEAVKQEEEEEQNLNHTQINEVVPDLMAPSTIGDEKVENDLTISTDIRKTTAIKKQPVKGSDSVDVDEERLFKRRGSDTLAVSPSKKTKEDPTGKKIPRKMNRRETL